MAVTHRETSRWVQDQGNRSPHPCWLCGGVVRWWAPPGTPNLVVPWPVMLLGWRERGAPPSLLGAELRCCMLPARRGAEGNRGREGCQRGWGARRCSAAQHQGPPPFSPPSCSTLRRWWEPAWAATGELVGRSTPGTACLIPRGLSRDVGTKLAVFVSPGFLCSSCHPRPRCWAGPGGARGSRVAAFARHRPAGRMTRISHAAAPGECDQSLVPPLPPARDARCTRDPQPRCPLPMAGVVSAFPGEQRRWRGGRELLGPRWLP